MKNLYQEYLHIPKDKHIPTKVFTTHVVLSVISVLACTLAMFASSYAWFSMEIRSDSNTIAAANFELSIEQVQGSAVAADDDLWTLNLSAGNQHVFQLRNTGTATTGYCVVEVDGEAFFTHQIEQETVLTLGITAAPGTEVVFYSHWGELNAQDVEYDRLYGNVEEEFTFASLLSLDNGEETEDWKPGKFIRGPEMPFLEYRFPQYATLEDVAAFYEIEVEDILIYNGIDDPEEIEIGDWLDLPYVDADAELFEPTPPDIGHVILEGETIESIAALYDISITELAEYNHLAAVEADTPAWHPLTPGDTLWIPFEATSGYTPSSAVREQDLPAKEPEVIRREDLPPKEPEEVWTENRISEGVLSTDEPEPLPDTIESPPAELPSGVLILGGAEAPPAQETPEEQPSGILTAD